MALTNDLFGTTRTIPQEGESYGDNLADTLDDLVEGVDNTAVQLTGSGLVTTKLNTASGTTSLAASATLTPTTTRMVIAGDGAPVTLDVTTAIADGDTEGQLLVLQGGHATNTVTINDGANTVMGGNVTLAIQDTVTLVWDAVNSAWVELCRSNN